MRFFQNRVFTLANVASLLMFFGMFGSIFLLSQFFQTVQGYSPLGSGLRILPWTIMPMFVAPIAGALSDRIGGARLMGIGLTLQAGGPRDRSRRSRRPRRRTGSSSRRSWSPASAWRCSGLRSPTSCSPRCGPEEEGQASGAQNAIRELGGVFGVAVLASVWSPYGGYCQRQTFVDGMLPALWIGAVVVLLGAVAAFMIPAREACRQVEEIPAEAAYADAA